MCCSMKNPEITHDVLNVLIFLEDFIFYSGMSRKVSSYTYLYWKLNSDKKLHFKTT